MGGFCGLGVGEALVEDNVNDPSTGLNYSGRALTSNYLDYKIPSIMQAPLAFTPLPVEGIDPVGPMGAKGIGENCTTATAAAIANALSNALGGYRFTRTPIKKEDIVAALQWMQSKGLI